mgnify:FL=1
MIEMAGEHRNSLKENKKKNKLVSVDSYRREGRNRLKANKVSWRWRNAEKNLLLLRSAMAIRKRLAGERKKKKEESKNKTEEKHYENRPLAGHVTERGNEEEERGALFVCFVNFKKQNQKKLFFYVCDVKSKA